MDGAHPTPILVIGMNRTGTKWLSNLLANHPEVVAVQHRDHTGILETNVFGAWPRKFPDLSLPDEYTGFIELWSRTDFFRITGADKELFYRLDPRPTQHLELFRILMEDLAVRRNQQLWLQKLSPWDAEAALRHFPSARFVVIERDRIDTLRSTHYLETEGERPISLKTITSHHLQERLLKQARRRGAVATRYETLRARPEEELSRLCSALGLSFDPSLLDLPWAKNTSFRSGESKRFEFSSAEARKIRTAGFLLDRLPDSALRATRALFRTRSAPFVGGTFRRINREKGLE